MSDWTDIKLFFLLFLLLFFCESKMNYSLNFFSCKREEKKNLISQQLETSLPRNRKYNTEHSVFITISRRAFDMWRAFAYIHKCLFICLLVSNRINKASNECILKQGQKKKNKKTLHTHIQSTTHLLLDGRNRHRTSMHTSIQIKWR